MARFPSFPNTRYEKSNYGYFSTVDRILSDDLEDAPLDMTAMTYSNSSGNSSYVNAGQSPTTSKPSSFTIEGSSFHPTYIPIPESSDTGQSPTTSKPISFSVEGSSFYPYIPIPESSDMGTIRSPPFPLYPLQKRQRLIGTGYSNNYDNLKCTALCSKSTSSFRHVSEECYMSACSTSVRGSKVTTVNSRSHFPFSVASSTNVIQCINSNVIHDNENNASFASSVNSDLLSPGNNDTDEVFSNKTEKAGEDSASKERHQQIGFLSDFGDKDNVVYHLRKESCAITKTDKIDDLNRNALLSDRNSIPHIEIKPRKKQSKMQNETKLRNIQTTSVLNMKDQSLSKESEKAHNMLRPPISYINLIRDAILSTPDKKALLQYIYRYLYDNYEFFRCTPTKWQNNVRHNLSVNRCFIVNKEKGSKTKGGYWSINPLCEYTFENGNLKRRKRMRLPNQSQSDVSVNVAPNVSVSVAPNVSVSVAPNVSVSVAPNVVPNFNQRYRPYHSHPCSQTRQYFNYSADLLSRGYKTMTSSDTNWPLSYLPNTIHYTTKSSQQIQALQFGYVQPSQRGTVSAASAQTGLTLPHACTTTSSVHLSSVLSDHYTDQHVRDSSWSAQLNHDCSQ